jgi:hypothetical protein
MGRQSRLTCPGFNTEDEIRDDKHSIVVQMVPVLGGKLQSGSILHHAEFELGPREGFS